MASIRSGPWVTANRQSLFRDLFVGRRRYFRDPESVAKIFHHGGLGQDIVIEYVIAERSMNALRMRNASRVGEKEEKTYDMAFRSGIYLAGIVEVLLQQESPFGMHSKFVDFSANCGRRIGVFQAFVVAIVDSIRQVGADAIRLITERRLEDGAGARGIWSWVDCGEV